MCNCCSSGEGSGKIHRGDDHGLGGMVTISTIGEKSGGRRGDKQRAGAQSKQSGMFGVVLLSPGYLSESPQ